MLTTLTTKMAHEPHDHDLDSSKLILPLFDPKAQPYFDNLQAYTQDCCLGWLLNAKHMPRQLPLR